MRGEEEGEDKLGGGEQGDITVCLPDVFHLVISTSPDDAARCSFGIFS